MILAESIAIGLLIGFIFYEWIGFLPGGLVVPGYIALYWDRPLIILSTLLISIVILMFVRGVSSFVILYGRRRFLLFVISGFALQWLFQLIVFKTSIIAIEIDTIGYIIPGLIANEMYRQNIVPTVLTLSVISVMVRLILIVFGRI